MRSLAVIVIASLLAVWASAADRERVPRVGDRTPSGNLIIHVFRELGSNRPLPVELTTDYGIMVFNDGDEAHPKSRFLLAVRKSGTVRSFSAPHEFESALAKLPSGAVLHKYDRCSIPTWHGLECEWERFKNRCAMLGLKVSDEQHGTCTCPD